MRVFISHSPDDEDLKNELLKHLAPAIRAGALAPWDASQVKAGDETSRVIEAELERAELALVALSANYLADGGPIERDLPRMEERRAAGRLRIVPIVLSACAWQTDTRLKGLQVLPRNGKPIRSQRDRDQALLEVCQEIVALASDARSSTPEAKPSPASDTSTSATGSAGRRPPLPVASPPAPSPSWRNPFSVLSAAIAAVPVMKYALGVAGLAAVVAITLGWFGLDPPTAVIGALVVVALMVVLLVLSAAGRQSKQLARQAVVLTWFYLIMTLGSSALLLASLFFHWPRPLRCLVHDEQCAAEKQRYELASGGSISVMADSAKVPPPPAFIDLRIDSTPSGARVFSPTNALQCEPTPCSLRVPAHAPLKLNFSAKGRYGEWETDNPQLEQEKGGVRFPIPLVKVR